MNRIFALLLALVMVFALAACGTNPASTPVAGDEIDTTASADVIDFDALTIYESDTFSIVVTGINAENPNGYTLNLTIANNMEAEEVLNIEYVYEVNEEGESEIAEEIEHYETVTTTLSCVLDSLKINGTAVELAFKSDVESGMRNYDQIAIDPALADTLGDFTEIELSFRVFDVSNPDVTIATATGTVYPYGNAPADATEAA